MPKLPDEKQKTTTYQKPHVNLQLYFPMLATESWNAAERSYEWNCPSFFCNQLYFSEIWQKLFKTISNNNTRFFWTIQIKLPQKPPPTLGLNEKFAAQQAFLQFVRALHSFALSWLSIAEKNWGFAAKVEKVVTSIKNNGCICISVGGGKNFVRSKLKIYSLGNKEHFLQLTAWSPYL